VKKGTTAFCADVDEYLDLTKELQQADLAHKLKYAGKKKRIGVLQELFTIRMKKGKLTKLEGTRGVVTPKTRTSSAISPTAFFQFLKSISQSAKFWQYISVGVGDAKKDWGENTLVESGVMVVEEDKYHSVTVNEL
jgi:hypothetical protein